MTISNAFKIPFEIIGTLAGLSLLLFGLTDYLQDKDYNAPYLPWFGVFFVVLGTFFTNIGLTTIPNLYSSVLFPQDIRPIQKSLSRGVNSSLIFLAVLVILKLVQNLWRFSRDDTKIAANT